MGEITLEMSFIVLAIAWIMTTSEVLQLRDKLDEVLNKKKGNKKKGNKKKGNKKKGDRI